MISVFLKTDSFAVGIRDDREDLSETEDTIACALNRLLDASPCDALRVFAATVAYRTVNSGRGRTIKAGEKFIEAALKFLET